MIPEKPSSRPRRPIPSVKDMAGTILLLLAFIAWVVIVILGFQLQEQIDRNLRLIMELAEHAGI